METEEVYGDYRETGGVKLPYHTVINHPGLKTGQKKTVEGKKTVEFQLNEIDINEIDINPGLEDAAYKEP